MIPNEAGTRVTALKCAANLAVIGEWEGTADGGSVRGLARACDRLRAPGVGLRIVEQLSLSGVPAVVIDDDPDARLARTKAPKAASLRELYGALAPVAVVPASGGNVVVCPRRWPRAGRTWLSLRPVQGGG